MVLGKVKRVLGFGHKGDPDYEKALGIAIAQNLSKTSMSEEEYAKLLGVNKELIHDPWEERGLETESYFYGQYKNEKDEVVTIPIARNWDMRALRTLQSHLNRVSFIDEKEAVLQKLYMERAVNGIEMNMVEDEYDMGMGNFFDAVKIQFRGAIDDSVDGRKAKLLKVMPRVTELFVNPEQKKKSSGWGL